MAKKLRQKLKYLDDKKSFQDEITSIIKGLSMKQKTHFVGRQLITIQFRQLIAIQDSALFIAFFLQLTPLIGCHHANSDI